PGAGDHRAGRQRWPARPAACAIATKSCPDDRAEPGSRGGSAAAWHADSAQLRTALHRSLRRGLSDARRAVRGAAGALSAGGYRRGAGDDAARRHPSDPGCPAAVARQRLARPATPALTMSRPAWSLHAFEMLLPDEQLDLFACREVRIHLLARQLELGAPVDRTLCGGVLPAQPQRLPLDRSWLRDR